MSAADLPDSSVRSSFPSPRGDMTKKERRNWVVALIVAFAIGFLLAWYLLRYQAPTTGCARPDDRGPLQSMNGATSGHGSRAGGSPTKLGSPGEGAADHKGNSRTTSAEGGGGAQGVGGPGDGTLRGGEQWQAHGSDQNFDGKSDASGKPPIDGGAAEGEAKDGMGGEGTKSPSQQMQAGRTAGPGSLYAESGRKAETGSPPPAAPPSASQPGADTVVAQDLRYDVSDLPRYPNAVTKQASGTTLPKGALAPDPNLSVSAILTSDDPQTVAAWYQSHLPPGWTEMNLGGLTVFWPPDRKTDQRSVWVLLDDKTNRTAALLWKPKKNP